MTEPKTEVLAANEQFYRAFEKKDLDAMSNVWSQGTLSTCIHPGGRAIRGWKEIYTSWSEIFHHTDYIEIDPELVSVEIGDRVAYVILIENVLQVSRGRRLEAQSLATNIFLKLGDRWYLVHHHGSPVVR